MWEEAKNNNQASAQEEPQTEAYQDEQAEEVLNKVEQLEILDI